MNFIILSTQRSGSQWLVNTLNNIDEVTCYGELFIYGPEVFRMGSTEKVNFLLHKRKKKKIRPFSTYQYLNDTFNQKHAVGIKIMYSQLKQYPELIPYILVKRIPVIHLIRRNRLNVIISRMVAQKRGKYHFNRSETIPEISPFKVDNEKLLKQIRQSGKRIAFINALLKFSRIKTLEIIYEDLESDINNFQKIWDFLGINFGKNPPVWQSRRNPKIPHSELISNYSEVCEKLSSAGFGNFLDQRLNTE